LKDEEIMKTMKSGAERQAQDKNWTKMQIVASPVSTINTGTESSSGARDGVLIILPLGDAAPPTVIR
jgi:hypothetical protein